MWSEPRRVVAQNPLGPEARLWLSKNDKSSSDVPGLVAVEESLEYTRPGGGPGPWHLALQEADSVLFSHHRSGDMASVEARGLGRSTGRPAGARMGGPK